MGDLYQHLADLAGKPGSVTFAGAILLAAFVLAQTIRAAFWKPNLLWEKAPSWMPVATVVAFGCLLGIDHVRTI